MSKAVAAVVAALFLAFMSPARSQSFSGIVEQRAVKIPAPVLLQLAGELDRAPTPEEEAFGFNATNVLARPLQELIASARRSGGGVVEQQSTLHIAPQGLRHESVLATGTPGSAGAPAPVALIVRPDLQVLWTLVPSRQVYTETPLASTPPDADQPESSEGEEEDVLPFAPTGEKATISGFPCERYLRRTAGELSEMWVTSAPPELRQSLEAAARLLNPESEGSDSAEWWRQFPGGLPIVHKEITAGGGLEVEEITRITRKALSPSLFEVPSGYRRVEMQKLIGQF